MAGRGACVCVCILGSRGAFVALVVLLGIHCVEAKLGWLSSSVVSPKDFTALPLEAFKIIRLRESDDSWSSEENSKSVSAIIKAELANYDPSVNWILDICPINLDILKAVHADNHLNMIICITVPDEEIISQAVEGHWDTDEIALKLAHSDYAMSRARSFFRSMGCPIYELRELEQEMEAEDCRAGHELDNDENWFISHCAAGISQDFNAMPMELLQDDETKAERHFRLHELVAQLRDLTEERRAQHLALLSDFFDRNEWYTNERINIINIFCLLLQLELDKWQDRNQVVGMLIGFAGSTEEGKLGNQNCYRLPMLKPPGLAIAEQSGESKSKRHQPLEGKVHTIAYTAEDPVGSNDGTDRPQMLFVTNEVLTGGEIIPLASDLASKVWARVPPLNRCRRNHQLGPGGGQSSPSVCLFLTVQLTEEQVKLGVHVDDNGDPLPRVEEPPKSQKIASSRSVQAIKGTKKASKDALISTIT
ncbi:unnamed protein product [Hydatigera taeniaeformis]|uniref:Guanylate cyclase domain-containing protein n=1 Tax=Hydatigena taeniaeformis TaxID=6205 RepID=A0A0R3WMY2_HYDTA|nr:unnamed protein product [Hydatigera taeniaeformis]